MADSAAIKKLYEERVNVWRQAQDILNEADTRNVDDPGVLTAEDQERYNKLEQRLQDINTTIETRKRADEQAVSYAQPRTTEVITSSGLEQAVSTEVREAVAFNDYMRHGMGSTQQLTGNGSMKPENRTAILGRFSELPTEARDIGVATGASGGFMVPQGFLEKLTEVMVYYGPVRQVANVIQTASGNDMPWPNNDDTANVGAILAENVAITALDVALTSKTLKAFMYTSLLVKASWQLLNDSAFDIETFLSRKLGQRIGRIQNTHFTTGSGTGQPEGITTNAQANSPKTVMATGTTTSFGAGAAALTNGFQGLVNTLHNINPAYRTTGNLSWQMADAVLGSTRQLADTSGRPVWIPSGTFSGVAGADPDTLLGYPVYINSDMSNFGVTKIIAMIGDWKQYYIVRDVLGVQMVRLDERFADQLQAGFFAYCRTDGRVDDVKAAASLVTAAT